MIIGVDAGCLGVVDDRLKVGVYRMTLALLKELLKLDDKNIYKLYSFLPIDKSVLKELKGKVENVIIKPSYGWLSFWLPLELRIRPVDSFLGFSQSLPKLPKETKSIVFIHDLTFEKYPQWFNSYHKMSRNSRYAVKNADCIIAVSSTTKRDLIQIYHANPKKIKVIYEAPIKFKKPSDSIIREILARFEIKEPFFLFVGTFKKSKNIPNILRAFALFLKKYPDFQLVLVGSDYWLDTEIEKISQELNLRNSLKKLGFVSDKVLGTLYSKASGFVSPSFYEGFGLTYLEAASFGVPIIAAKQGSVYEIIKNGALYVDPSSPEDIAKAMQIITQQSKLRDDLIKKAQKNTYRFSWEKSAKSLLKILNNYEKK